MTFIQDEDGDWANVLDLVVHDPKPIRTKIKGPDGKLLWWVPARVGFHNPLGEQPYDLLPYDKPPPARKRR